MFCKQDGCLVDFYTTSLLTMRAYNYTHVLCLNLEKYWILDRSLCIEKMLTLYLNRMQYRIFVFNAVLLYLKSFI